MGEDIQDQLLKILEDCHNIVIYDDVRSYILNCYRPKVASKILYSIALLNNNGLSLGERYIHRIWESKYSLWELRIRFANARERILFFAIDDGKFLLTRCFNKTTDKVPSIEIRRAERIYEWYLKERRR
ncbi:MAG: type II toxin-antitoxin system RelE/ParE family toxin [Bacillota bacterium]|nr:type II toxin-antitoxin system RelE/ParE family toxin [Bacillota bacterium]